MADYPGAAWLARYRERVNGDAELKVIGDWFTTTFGLTFGDTRYAVKVETVTTADEDMFFPLPRVLRGPEAAE